MAHSQAKGAWRRLPLSVPPALHYPAYRAFWLGLLASVSGFQMLRFGQFWLVYQLTGSPLALGYVGLANGVPAICLNLFGGVFADRFDQRRLIMTTQSLTASLIFVLATLTLLNVVQVWHVLVIAFCAGAVESFDQPARQSLYPHLIDRKVMVSAVALNSSIWQGTRIIMPAVAGCIIAWTGTAVAFYLAGLGFLTMATVMYRLQVPPITRQARGSAVHDIREGLTFIRQNSIFSFLIAMTFFNSFFGLAYITLMPVLAVEILHVGAKGQGLLMGAGGVGSLLTTLWLSCTEPRWVQGLADHRRRCHEWAVHRHLGADLGVRWVLRAGSGYHVCHWYLQYHLHHLDPELSPDAGSRPHARPCHGFLWDDL